MERLTQWIEANRAITRVDLKRCGYERCTTQLARYEDTGLTPEQVQELKERGMAKDILEGNNGFGICPRCCREFNTELIEKYEIEYCPWCGQRLSN